MYIKEFLKQFDNKKIKIFVDMDGVIADYEFGKPFDYDKKRPLFETIRKLENISHNDNVQLYILSVTRMDNGIEQKNIWLDKYAPFFMKDNRIIISRESNNMESSSILKAKYLQSIKRDDHIIIVIDDDPRVLNEINNSNNDVYLLKDCILDD